MAAKLIEYVKKAFPDVVIDSHSRLGNDTVIMRPEMLREVMFFLRDDPRCACNLLRDITAVDYLHRVPRFEVVYIVYSLEHKHQLIVRALVDEGDCRAPSLASVYPVASWLEREVWDMYGVKFDDHPDLRRVLLYEEFEGHPLRKDYHTQASQPRIELRKRERDSVEEYNVFMRDQKSGGSREEL